MAAGAVITGSVLLNDGSDTFNVAFGTNLAGITSLNGGDDVLLADGFIDNLNLNTAWTGSLNGANILNWEFININGGTVGFSNAAITAGQINVNNLGTFNGSNNLAVTGNVAIASGSRILAGNATGNNVFGVSGNLTNFGLVQMTGPTGQQSAGDRLNVSGNFIGSAGQITLDTVLGNDASATDRLVVTGSTTGTTGLFVNNVGGLGALTTGDGIMVVNVAGASGANAFSLSNNLAAGAFNYFLYQNGISNPSDGDWYLRSSARAVTSPAVVIPSMGNNVSLSMLGTLQERMGMRGLEASSGAWIRTVGNTGQQTQQTSIGDFKGRNDNSFVQVGVDLSHSENLRWGVFAAKAISTSHMFDLSFDPSAQVGQANTDGYAAGVYATYFTDTYYWDAVIQQAWYESKASGAGQSLETDSKNWLGSFEFGRAFKFSNNNALEPQAQLIIGQSNTDNSTDGFTTYTYSDEDVMVGRLGVRWTNAKNNAGAKGSFVPYLKANVWSNFGDDSRVQIGVTDISTERNDTWAEIGMGFSMTTMHNWSILMQFGFENGLGQSDRENYTGTLGFRRNW